MFTAPSCSMLYMHLLIIHGEALAALEILGFSSWSCTETHVTLSLQSLETDQLRYGFIRNCSRCFIASLSQIPNGKWWWLTNGYQGDLTFEQTSVAIGILLMTVDLPLADAFWLLFATAGLHLWKWCLYQAVPAAHRITRWIFKCLQLALFVALRCSSLSSNFW